jgi:hypothetical protein
VLNWLAIDALLGRASPERDSWLARIQVAAKQRFERTRASWDAIAIADAQLLAHVLHDTLDTDGVEAQLVALYVGAAEEAQLTERERDSLTSQMSFMQEFGTRLSKGKAPPWRPALPPALPRLARRRDPRTRTSPKKPARPTLYSEGRSARSKRPRRQRRRSHLQRVAACRRGLSTSRDIRH